ncbi:MAG: phosphate acyltransferase PlsX [Fimbriimonadaceae bacterium]
MARILLDAMGGDKAPAEIIAGALEAAPLLKHEIVLLGDPAAINAHLPGPCPPNIQIHPTSEVIGMHEKPIEAIRKKKDSSIVVGVDLVKQGEGDVFVSAGNTGACSAASLLAWRQMPGFHRPAIASEFPNYHGRLLLLDAGASPDVDPEQLVEFAIMGRAYASAVMGRANPRVWLLNMGEEEGKGNMFAKNAFNILANHEWFAGNIESKDIFDQPVDVVVCDAFVGNIVLKTAEGVAEIIMRMIKDQVPSGIAALPYAPLKKLFRPLREKMDYAEYGGSPLLGLNHLTIICHGRSNAKAIKNALLLAQKSIDMGLLAKIRESVARELPS